mgnify:CR=1 FL=1
MGKVRRRFTREFKVSAVRMVVDKGVPLVEVAESFGIHPSCLRQWGKEYAALGNGSFPGNGKLTESQMKHHHPLEYAEIISAEERRVAAQSGKQTEAAEKQS